LAPLWRGLGQRWFCPGRPRTALAWFEPVQLRAASLGQRRFSAV
jgi:hypothetical protein